jgi:aminoglycoside 6'-N-acetyltransferase I
MAPMNNLHIRTATPTDRAALAHLRALLWPESSFEEHARELITLLNGTAQRILPLIIFVAEEHDGALVGFLEAGLRSCADGCDESRPVGYVEGWFVEGHHRGQGIGARLLRAAEDWARAQGCREMASDTDIENKLSQRVHEASGFTVAARAILYRKFL